MDGGDADCALDHRGDAGPPWKFESLVEVHEGCGVGTGVGWRMQVGFVVEVQEGLVERQRQLMRKKTMMMEQIAGKNN